MPDCQIRDQRPRKPMSSYLMEKIFKEWHPFRTGGRGAVERQGGGSNGATGLDLRPSGTPERAVGGEV